jgi:hypothetical protein
VIISPGAIWEGLKDFDRKEKLQVRKEELSFALRSLRLFFEHFAVTVFSAAD